MALPFPITVAAVKTKLRSLLDGTSRSECEAGARHDVNIRETDRISFSFSGRQMQDDKKLYADHFMVLPAWCKYDCTIASSRSSWSSRTS